MKSTRIALACVSVLLTVPAAAQSPAANEGPASAPSTAKPTTKSGTADGTESGVRRDPTGVRGINPFWEALTEGDRAYIARDYDAAIKAYRQAITRQPKAALGHLRMAEAQMKKEELTAAEEAAAAGLRFAGNDGTLKAKALFLIAEISERKAAYDAAVEAWAAYETHAKVQSKAKTYPASAAERKQRAATRKQMLADYSAVKERIEKRLKEVDEQARKNAK